MKTIGICCDHAGYALKQYVKEWLEAKGLEYKDFGTYSPESVDYPDFAHPLAQAEVVVNLGPWKPYVIEICPDEISAIILGMKNGLNFGPTVSLFSV